MKTHEHKAQACQGYSLLEMAVVLVITGLLLGGSLHVAAGHIEKQRRQNTRAQLALAHEALLGFAMAHGRLPCPASLTSHGEESPSGGGPCTHAHDGWLPAATLGLSGLDSDGYLPTPWPGNRSRLRYAVTTAQTSSATTTDGIRQTGISAFAPNLSVCTTATGISNSSCGSAPALTNTAVAIVWSEGSNAGQAASGLDENTNRAAGRIFISHPPTGTGAPLGAFDDQLDWLSMHILYSRMIAAGRLP